MLQTDRTFEAANYETKLPVRAGVIAGFAGALAIIVVVTAILIFTGSDIWTAARLIASTVYGDAAAEGAGPIIIGTAIHLLTGAILGGVFARLMPRVHRNMYVIAGVMYGIAAWAISTFLILPIVAPAIVVGSVNIYILFFAHVVYGIVLGLVGGSYGLLWKLPPQWDGTMPARSTTVKRA